MHHNFIIVQKHNVPKDLATWNLGLCSSQVRNWYGCYSGVKGEALRWLESRSWGMTGDWLEIQSMRGIAWNGMMRYRLTGCTAAWQNQRLHICRHWAPKPTVAASKYRLSDIFVGLVHVFI